MARINLLPWRDELRQERQRHFLSMLALSSILGIVAVFLVGTGFDRKINHQMARNNLVAQEIRNLEVRIRRIGELERTRGRLISRKQVIERLQASRSMTVELLDNLAKSIPEGVTLVTVRQQGSNLELTGTSQSNARVSAYLKELELNDLFQRPQLDYVRAISQAGNTMEPYQFSIRVILRPPKSMADDAFDDQPDQGGSG